MYADILSRLFQIKKGVIINKTHVVVSPQQLILCTRFDKKSSEFIVNKKCLIVSYKYPQNSENLMKMTSDDPFVIENKEFTLADYAYTENKSSFFFLLKDENDNTYIMSATKFPLVDRYELFDRKIFYDKEILEKKDFYNKVVVVNENDKLVLQEKKIFPIQYLCIVLTAVVLIIRILAGFIKKR